MTRYLAPVAIVALAACGDPHTTPPDGPPPDGAQPAPRLGHSSSIAASRNGKVVYVVNADLDSVSMLDPGNRVLMAEILLGSAPPAVDAQGRFTPAVMPRALALSDDENTLYVTGQRSGALYAIDVAKRTARSVPVCSEPVGVAVDAAAIYVACSQDAVVAKVDAASFTVTGTVAVASGPWGLGWASNGNLIVTHLVDPHLVAIDPKTFTAQASWLVPGVAPRADARLAHGEVRGAYDVATRPGSDELWVAHMLLGTDTAQPELDFERTVFPALSLLRPDGTRRVTLSIDAQDVTGIDGAFADIVSGPHAIAFTGDGNFALVLDTNSEDVLVVDTRRSVEVGLLRPLPGHMPEGIALSADGKVAYIDERNTGDVAVLSIDQTGDKLALAVDGAPIARSADPDPMPAQLRFGQHLFYSANSDEYPITRNHWVACASCHLEGRSDAVTWLFEQGPRDTPSNAGGMLGTGFLFRVAARNTVNDYWHTINVEQGGSFDPVIHKDLLDAITAYVNFAIPLPVPPKTDAAKVAAGKLIFERADVGCAGCHAGAMFTDSGKNNPTLDLAGTITLHDVGTCVTGPFADVTSSDVEGHPRAACLFDTPSLRGVSGSPPYLHDGSAPTLDDVLEKTRGKMGDITSLSTEQRAALVEYLRSL